MPKHRLPAPVDTEDGQKATLDYGDGIKWKWVYNADTEKWSLDEVVPAAPPSPTEKSPKK